MTQSDRLVDTERGIVSREIFVNDGIFAEEQEKLFARAWLFVGHESQVAKPGDCPAWISSGSNPHDSNLQQQPWAQSGGVAWRECRLARTLLRR